MNATVNKQWFLARLEERQMNQAGLAKALELDRSAVSLMLSGQRGWRAEELAATARVLNQPLNEVARHAGIEAAGSPTGSMVKVIGIADAKGEVVRGNAPGPKTVVAPADNDDDVRAIRVLSNGGQFDGWLVYFRDNHRVASDITGRLCVVRPEKSDHEYVCWVHRGYDEGYYRMVKLDGSEDYGRLENASPAIWLRQ